MRGELAFGTVDSWLIWRLTGGKQHATDATNASRTLLFDIHRGAWDAGLCALFDVPMALLPEVRDCAGDFGLSDPSVLGHAVPIRGVKVWCWETNLCIKSTSSALLTDA